MSKLVQVSVPTVMVRLSDLEVTGTQTVSPDSASTRLHTMWCGLFGLLAITTSPVYECGYSPPCMRVPCLWTRGSSKLSAMVHMPVQQYDLASLAEIEWLGKVLKNSARKQKLRLQILSQPSPKWGSLNPGREIEDDAGQIVQRVWCGSHCGDMCWEQVEPEPSDRWAGPAHQRQRSACGC